MKRILPIILLLALGLDSTAQRAWVVTEDGLTPPGDIFAESPFAIGFAAGCGFNSISYKDAAFRGRNGFEYCVGASLQYDMIKALSLRCDIMYDAAACPYPSTVDPFGSYSTLRQSSLSVPASLLFRSGWSSPVCSVAGFGAYYERVFTSTLGGRDIFSGIDSDRWGLSLCLGIELWDFSILYIHRYQMDRMFSSGEFPSASHSIGSFVLSYRFR